MGHFTKLVSIAAATLLLFNALAFAQGQPQDSSQPEGPDAKEVRTFKLNTAKVDQYDVATKGVAKVLHDHPEIKKKMDDGSAAPADSADKDEHTIDRSVKNLEAFPEVSSAIKGSGLSVREYVVMTITLMNSMMVVALKKQGLIQEYPSNISHQNAAFLEQNYDRVSHIMEPLMSGMGGMPQGDSKDQNNDPKKKDQN
jgi:hypothetical protein